MRPNTLNVVFLSDLEKKRRDQLICKTDFL